MVKDEEKFKKLQELIQGKVRKTYEGEVKLFPFAPELVSQLGAKYALAIISSTTSDVIHKKLASRNLKKFFPIILGPEGTTSKKDKLLTILKQFSLPKENVYFISDTIGDIAEGKETGLKTIAVTWGFHDRETLSQIKPDFLAGTAEELLAIL